MALGLGCFLLAEWERPQSGLLVIVVRQEADYSEPAGPLASLGRSPATRPPLRLSRLVPPACGPGEHWCTPAAPSSGCAAVPASGDRAAQQRRVLASLISAACPRFTRARRVAACEKRRTSQALRRGRAAAHAAH